jgi:hypothetical protein
MAFRFEGLEIFHEHESDKMKRSGESSSKRLKAFKRTLR